MSDVEAVPDRVEFLVVDLGDRRCAIETGHVDGVMECPPVTRVPRARDTVEGVAAVDGEVLVVVRPGGLGGTGSDLLRFERVGGPVGIRIDRAHGVGRYPVEALSAMDATTSGLFDADERWFKAVLETEDGDRLPVLDRDRIVDAARSR